MVALKVKDVEGPHVSTPYIGGIWPTGILTCNQGVIRRRLLRDIDYFDEAYRDYGIDADITAKVLQACYKVVYTKRVAVHHHRDHETLPGAIDNSHRAPRFKAAQELYRRKYAALLRHSLIDRTVSHSGRTIWRLIERLDNAGLGMDGVFGYNKRDWYNVLHCRYVSKFDLLRNLERPYYLVQRIRE
jgi:GT2 family glycosyltransferase